MAGMVVLPRQQRRGTRNSWTASDTAVSADFHPGLRSAGLTAGLVSAAGAVPEAFLVEGLLFAEHVVDGPRQPCGQDAQDLAGTAFLLLLLLPGAGAFRAAQEQAD